MDDESKTLLERCRGQLTYLARDDGTRAAYAERLIDDIDRAIAKRDSSAMLASAVSPIHRCENCDGLWRRAILACAGAEQLRTIIAMVEANRQKRDTAGTVPAKAIP